MGMMTVNLVWPVFQIAEADAHVMRDRTGETDRDANAEDRVGDGQRVKVAIAQKEKTGCQAKDQGRHGEDGAGKVSEREDARR